MVLFDLKIYRVLISARSYEGRNLSYGRDEMDDLALLGGVGLAAVDR